MNIVFNPFTGNLDEVSIDVVQVSSPSTSPNKRIEEIADGSANGVLYFWVNGRRFQLVGTVDNTVFVGANAALSLLGP